MVTTRAEIRKSLDKWRVLHSITTLRSEFAMRRRNFQEKQKMNEKSFWFHAKNIYIFQQPLTRTSRGKVAIIKVHPHKHKTAPSSSLHPCYFLCTPKIYFITQTILIRAPSRQQQKCCCDLLLSWHFVPRLIPRLLPEQDGAKTNENTFLPSTAISTMFTLFNTNTIPNVLRLFCVKISPRSEQKALTVYATRQNIFIPDISQLANQDDVVLCYYGDCWPEWEGMTCALLTHLHNTASDGGDGEGYKSEGMKKEKDPSDSTITSKSILRY